MFGIRIRKWNFVRHMQATFAAIEKCDHEHSISREEVDRLAKVVEALGEYSPGDDNVAFLKERLRLYVCCFGTVARRRPRIRPLVTGLITFVTCSVAVVAFQQSAILMVPVVGFAFIVFMVLVGIKDVIENRK